MDSNLRRRERMNETLHYNIRYGWERSNLDEKHSKFGDEMLHEYYFEEISCRENNDYPSISVYQIKESLNLPLSFPLYIIVFKTDLSIQFATADDLISVYEVLNKFNGLFLYQLLKNGKGQ
jgi:hypothetical protein